MPTDLVSQAEQYREIAVSLRRLANEAIRHRPQLIAIAQDLEALADRVEEDPTAD